MHAHMLELSTFSADFDRITVLTSLVLNITPRFFPSNSFHTLVILLELITMKSIEGNSYGWNIIGWLIFTRGVVQFKFFKT